MTSGSHFSRLHFRPNFLECYSQGERGRSAVKGDLPSEEPSWGDNPVWSHPVLCVFGVTESKGRDSNKPTAMSGSRNCIPA